MTLGWFPWSGSVYCWTGCACCSRPRAGVSHNSFLYLYSTCPVKGRESAQSDNTMAKTVLCVNPSGLGPHQNNLYEGLVQGSCEVSKTVDPFSISKSLRQGRAEGKTCIEPIQPCPLSEGLPHQSRKRQERTYVLVRVMIIYPYVTNCFDVHVKQAVGSNLLRSMSVVVQLDEANCAGGT